MIKDESVLKNLVLQEAKKKESVRNAEAKITKLTEQLQAAEKILSANRMFLKKLQEQVMLFPKKLATVKLSSAVCCIFKAFYLYSCVCVCVCVCRLS